jgi:exopolyphosphatase/pppGpp-phosphohydrolase
LKQIRIYALLLALTLTGTCAAQNTEAAAADQTQKYYAAIDLGSKGVKAFLYFFSRDGELLDATTLFKNDVNTKLVSGAQDGKFTAAGIEEATQAASRLLEELKAAATTNKIANVSYYIVGSSGVAQFANREELKQAVDKATGLSMSFVDANEEGYYGLLSAIPRPRRPMSASVDIGSGNTKIACMQDGKAATSQIPYGSVTLRNAALAKAPQPADYPNAVNTIIDSEVRKQVTGCGSERARLYWIGGAAWATATFTHPERATWGYVPISRADIDGFLKQLKDGTWNQGGPHFQFAPEVTAKQREAATKAATADQQRVQGVFSREDLLAGVSLMKAVLDGHSAPPSVYFVRNGNYLFGWALEKYNADSGATAGATPGAAAQPSYFAGIDLGSRGAKAYIYAFTEEGENLQAQIVFKDTVNTKLVSSAQGKMFTSAGIEEATAAVTRLVGEMRAAAGEKGIAPQYYLVGSSGVAAFENRAELKSVVDAATGMSLEFVDARTEAEDALRSAVPSKRLQEAILVDIGSGNTKLGCMTGTVFNSEEIPYGSTTLRKTVAPEKDYDAGLQESLTKVAGAYRVSRMNTPCLGNRKRFYLVGGAPWATATYARPEAQGWGYVPLARQDVDGFFTSLRSGKWNQDEPRFTFDPKVTAAQQAKIRKDNLAERTNVQNVFGREDLMAGVSLIRTVLDEGNPKASVYFVRNGNYLFGYALGKFKDIQLAQAAPE